MIKLTFKQIRDNADFFNKLVTVALPAMQSYKLAMLLGKLKEESNAIEKVRISMVKKYGELDPETNNINVKEETLELFAAEFETFLETEKEFDFDKVKLSVLANSEDVKFTPAEMYGLRDIIENDLE